MDYYRTKEDALAANPNARYVYVDGKGIGGSNRWYASVRILKTAKKYLEKQGVKHRELISTNDYPVKIELF